jgi:exosome complex component RRP41
MKKEQQLVIGGKRLDGRAVDELRPIKIEVGTLKNADGSAYIEWGNNKVLAAVYGPKEAFPKHVSDPQKAIIKCRYMMAPFSSREEHGRTGPNRRATEISKVTKEVFENVIMLDRFPGCEIDIYVEVLQSDGSTRVAGITAAAVAVASSGIPMTDIPFAVSVGRVGEHLMLDLNYIEDSGGDVDMPVAIGPRKNDVKFLQMDGSLTQEEYKAAIAMARKAGVEISRLQRAALEGMYLK